MKARPILFSTEMVRALLDGRKTQTRRVIRLQPDDKDQEIKLENGWLMYRRAGIGWCKDTPCPYGVPGDLLYVKETWNTAANDKGNDCPQYRSNIDPSEWELYGPWKSERFMPRRFSRMTLRLNQVWVQRIQDISNADAVAEGIGTPLDFRYAAQDGFRPLWDSINAARGYGWDANPWVWALSFEVIRANVDQVLREAA